MRRNATLITLLAVEIGVAALSLVYQLRLRPEVLGAFQAEGAEMPAATRLAVAPAPQPAALAIAGLLTLLAFGLPLKRSRRNALLSAGLFVLSSVVIFAVIAAVTPIFNPG